MALHDDLLEQAEHLARLDKVGPPRQANLRRSVSTAYYALFHLLIAEAVSLLPARPIALRQQASRSFSHDEMKRVCSGIASGNPEKTTALIMSPLKFSSPVRAVASVFDDLQDALHRADYDVFWRFTRSEALRLLFLTRLTFAMWRRVCTNEEAKVFLVALMLQKKWSR